MRLLMSLLIKLLKGKYMYIERVRHSGALIVSELVKDNATPFAWYESKTYYGYTLKEAKSLFRAYLEANNFKVVK